MMLNKKSLEHIRILCFILVVLSFTFSSCSGPKQISDTNVKRTPVSVLSVERGDIDNITLYTGLVIPKETSYVTSVLSGKVSSSFFDVGDRVKKGDLLFTVENAELKDSIGILEEQLKVAQANISLAKTGVVSAMGSGFKGQKLQLEAALKSSEYNYIAAKKLFDSSTLLYELKKISVFNYNKVKNQFEQAKTALETAQTAYELYINEVSKDAVDSANEQLNQAQASYDAIKLQLESTRKKLEYTRITSPISGIIAVKDLVSGALITNTMVPYVILDTDTVQISIPVTEQIINKVKKNDTLEITIPAARTEPFTGVVKTVSPAPDTKTITYNILIDVSNEDNLIKPGMTAKVGMLTEQRKNALLVPLNSVLSDSEGKYVFIIEDNIAIKRSVDVGITNNDMIEILKGIETHELIVVKGQHLLKQNYPVTIVGEALK